MTTKTRDISRQILYSALSQVRARRMAFVCLYCGKKNVPKYERQYDRGAVSEIHRGCGGRVVWREAP